MQKKEPLTLDVAQKRLEEAVAAYGSAKDNLEMARREETAALNRLNDAQNKFDAAVEAIKETTVRNSNWGRVKYDKR